MTDARYLDHNATAPIRPAAAEAVRAALARTGNPSSVHAAGRAARATVEAARETVAAAMGASPAEVVFTSGATEANAIALARHAGPVLVSAIEHPSVLEAADPAALIPVDPDGVVDVDALDALLESAGPNALVSVMLANNETGVLQPIAAVVETARKHGAAVHCDAVQAAGRFALDFAGLGLDMLSLSSHKLGGPQGAGALIVRDGDDVTPLWRGGGQERGRRGGTENTPSIAGFGAAVAEATTNVSYEDFTALAALRDRMEDALVALAPELVVIGGGAPRLANTSCFALPGLAAETQVIALDLAGIQVSAGAACSSGKVGPSHVLKAMGAAPDAMAAAIRVSLGWNSTEDDVDAFLAAWTHLYRRRAEAA